MTSKTLMLYLLTSLFFNLHSSAQHNYAVFQEQPISALRPEGWMQKMLQRQKDGLTGHMGVAGDPFEKEGWGYSKDKKMEDWAQYEQTGYWADGALRCGYLTGDTALQQKVKSWIAYQISHPDSTGFIGPKDIAFLWPEVVFFRAVMAEYEVTHDPKILRALSLNYHSPKYADLNNADKDNEFKDRIILHIEMLCWLYQRTGDAFYLKKSEDTYRIFSAAGGEFSIQALASNAVPHSHSVSYCENIKIPVILYASTGNKMYLDAAINGMQKLYQYHGLVDGLPSGNEYHDGNFSNEVHETCTVSDMEWAIGYLLQATGEGRWADMIEKICFNAGLGSISKDFKSYQYYSGPNQVIANGLSSHWNDHQNWYMNSRDRAAFKINHRPSCCGGNVNRMLPVFCARMWMKSGTNGLVAALYTPSTFKTTLAGVKGEITIKEETNYPFDQNIKFNIGLERRSRFTLFLRIPSWCESAQVFVNDKPLNVPCIAGTFIKLNQYFTNGDVVELRLPMTVKPVYLPENGIAFERGPLVYALSIAATSTVKDSKVSEKITFSSTYKTPAFAWNLAPLENTPIMVSQSQDFSDPWNPETTPIKLKMEGVMINNWSLYRNSYTPQLPSVINKGSRHPITLVPLGSTELRLTIFPDLLKTFSRDTLFKGPR